MDEGRKMKRNIAAYLLFALIFGTALLLCSMISWSDGDDAFFLQETATRLVIWMLSEALPTRKS